MNKRLFSIFIIIIFTVSFSVIVLGRCSYLNTYPNKETEPINSETETKTQPFINKSDADIGIPHTDSNDQKEEDTEYMIIELKIKY